MSYFSESEIARVEWRVRQLHEKIRELGGGSSRHHSGSQLDAAISQQRRSLEQARSMAPGDTSSAPASKADFGGEIGKLRDEAAKAKRDFDVAQSESVKLKDELTKLNTEKMRRLGQMERLEESIKVRKIDLERDLSSEQQKLSELKNSNRADPGTVQLKRQLARKQKQLVGKEKMWYGLSLAKQKGSLTEGGRKKEEQALKSEVRGLKSEVRLLREQLKKADRVSATAGSARTAGRVQRQLKIIADIQKDIADIDKDADRERAEHDMFMADFHKRERVITQELSRHQESLQRRQREEQVWRVKQREMEEKQRQASGQDTASAQSSAAGAGGQIHMIEQKIKDLEAQKEKEGNKKFQVEKMELDMKVLERDMQMLESSIASAEPQLVAACQSRLRRMMNDFNQAKEDFQKLK